MSIENTLAERGSRYGDFKDHAGIAQSIKRGMMCAGMDDLPDMHRQALEVIADKIARILSGDPNYADNWHDIQGYAKLVEDRLPQPAEGLFDEAAAVAAKAAADVDLQQMRSDGTPIDPADVDISGEVEPSDLPPDQWQKGDVVVALHSCDGQFSRLKRYTLRSANELQTVKVVADDRGEENGWGIHNFRFHSRPTK